MIYRITTKIIGEATIEVEADDEATAIARAKDEIEASNFDYWEVSDVVDIVKDI
jgi:hypothetical protein